MCFSLSIEQNAFASLCLRVFQAQNKKTNSNSVTFEISIILLIRTSDLKGQNEMIALHGVRGLAASKVLGGQP